MNKTFLFSFFAFAVSFSFANEPIDLKMDELKNNPSNSFVYLRMGVSDDNVEIKDPTMLPGLGVGYRIVAPSSAIDISASFNRKEEMTDLGKEKTLFYTFPKANYLYYLSGDKNQSFYVGAGLSWGGIRKGKTQDFVGLISNGAIGYEMSRTSVIRSFIQLDVFQPSIAAFQDGAFPKTYAELSLGAGF